MEKLDQSKLEQLKFQKEALLRNKSNGSGKQYMDKIDKLWKHRLEKDKTVGDRLDNE